MLVEIAPRRSVILPRPISDERTKPTRNTNGVKESHSGASALLWDTGRHRFLFTSDTIYFGGGELVATVLDRSDRGDYIESLEIIRALDFDVLVPWASTTGQP